MNFGLVQAERSEACASNFSLLRSRGIATCTHGRTSVPEKTSKKGKSGVRIAKTKNIQIIISEVTGKND